MHQAAFVFQQIFLIHCVFCSFSGWEISYLHKVSDWIYGVYNNYQVL